MEDFIICPHCGKEVKKRKFCTACGKVIEANACKKCGQALDENEKFCPSCGKKVVCEGERKQVITSFVSRVWASIKKSVCENKKTVITLAICLLVILGAAFVYWRPHYLNEGEKVLVNGAELEGYDYWQRYGFGQIKLVEKDIENGIKHCTIVDASVFCGEVKE